jgi:hypothetical protein
MYAKGKIVLVAVCLLLMSVAVGAIDSKSWLPFVPSTLGGLNASGPPVHVDMDMGTQSMHNLTQEYSDNSKRKISLTILSGAAAQAQAQQSMSHVQIETQDQVVKTVNVSGYKSLFTLNKVSKNGTLIISLDTQTLVIIDAVPITTEKEMLPLAKEVPLKKIKTASQAK